MRISVIICTYRRAAELLRLLDCLETQTHGNFETLIVDGSGQNDAVRVAYTGWRSAVAGRSRPRFIESSTGLTRQRNVGLAHQNGDIVCFLDDDVTVAPDFLHQVETFFAAAENATVGGMTGYDTRNWPQSAGFRWKLRRWLGVAPSLKAGDADRLGRNVPISFMPENAGNREVKWLPGFCMIYRTAAIDKLAFDEVLPTYGGEDRDFSLAVGKKWRLMLCSDVRLEHHQAESNRLAGCRQVYETGFGQGRGFRKFAKGFVDLPRLLAHAGAELAIDMMGVARSPSWQNLVQPCARLRGLVDGWRSLRKFPATISLPVCSAARTAERNEA